MIKLIPVNVIDAVDETVFVACQFDVIGFNKKNFGVEVNFWVAKVVVPNYCKQIIIVIFYYMRCKTSKWWLIVTKGIQT